MALYLSKLKVEIRRSYSFPSIAQGDVLQPSGYLVHKIALSTDSRHSLCGVGVIPFNDMLVLPQQQILRRRDFEKIMHTESHIIVLSANPSFSKKQLVQVYR